MPHLLQHHRGSAAAGRSATAAAPPAIRPSGTTTAAAIRASRAASSTGLRSASPAGSPAIRASRTASASGLRSASAAGSPAIRASRTASAAGLRSASPVGASAIRASRTGRAPIRASRTTSAGHRASLLSPAGNHPASDKLLPRPHGRQGGATRQPPAVFRPTGDRRTPHQRPPVRRPAAHGRQGLPPAFDPVQDHPQDPHQPGRNPAHGRGFRGIDSILARRSHCGGRPGDPAAAPHHTDCPGATDIAGHF
jgi:hypothetical protein